ncbi:MAG: Crp/Fnr family transcriptional regulator [Pseudorhodoplanes sp.]
MNASQNLVLAQLPEAAFQSIAAHLRTFDMVDGRVLVDAGEELNKVYFPESGIISITIPVADGASVQVAMIGRGSVFGFGAAFDAQISLSRAVVQAKGVVSTLDIGKLRTVAEQNPAFRATLMGHEQMLFAQAQQTAGCNATHSIEARLARWLLWMDDLSSDPLMHVTQDALARMIGVQRNSVSLVANSLLQAGVIRYSRGTIEVVSRVGLLNSACECYGIIRKQYNGRCSSLV